jgi:hypothetical protein
MGQVFLLRECVHIWELGVLSCGHGWYQMDAPPISEGREAIDDSSQPSGKRRLRKFRRLALPGNA